MSQGKGASSSYSSRSLFMEVRISCSACGERSVGVSESSESVCISMVLADNKRLDEVWWWGWVGLG